MVQKDCNSYFYVILDNDHIIGCIFLCIFHSPTGTKASIEDVVVSSAYRGQHLGKHLMGHVMEKIKKFVPIELHLTSNPKRVLQTIYTNSSDFKRKRQTATS